MGWRSRLWALAAACLAAACGGGSSGNPSAPSSQSTITSVSPESGLPNAQIVVNGSSLSGVTSVVCGGLAATFTVSSNTQLTFKVPTGAPAGGLVLAGSGFSISAPFTILNEPLVQTVNGNPPASGYTSFTVGSTFTITGQYLDQAAGYTLGTSQVTVLSSTAVAATLRMPAQLAFGPLTIIDKAGNALQTAFQMAAYVPITVASMTPASGTIGSSVTFAGTGLDAVQSVLFYGAGSGEGANITAQSPNSITVTVPPTAASGLVSIASPFQAAVASPAPFKFIPRIWVTDIASVTTVSSSLTVTITGANLDQVSSASIGATTAAIQSQSASKLVLTAVSTASGSVVLNSTTQPPVSAGAVSISNSGTLTLAGIDVGQVLNYSWADPHLRLTPGRPAMLRVYLTSSSPGAAPPPVQANVYQNGSLVSTLPVTGPASLSNTYSRSDLTTSFNAVIPGTLVQPGLSVQVNAGALSMTVQPGVGAPAALSLVLVPLIVGSSTGSVPPVSTVANLLSMLYPYNAGSMSVTVRAGAVSTGLGSIASASDFATALQALEATRRQDGATSSFYYGLLPAASISSTTKNSSYINEPYNTASWQLSATGTDDTTTSRMVSPFPSFGIPNWEFNLVHGLGHTHSLRDAPCGSPSSPDPNFPYAGASLGGLAVYSSLYTANATWALGDSTGMTDAMGYCNGLWLSDYNYHYVQQFAEAYNAANGATAGTASAALAMARAAPLNGGSAGYIAWSGIGTKSGVHLVPAIASSIALASPSAPPADYVLRVTTDRGEIVDLPVQPVELADVEADAWSFFVGMANPGPVASVVLLQGGMPVPQLDAAGKRVFQAGPMGRRATGSLHYSFADGRLLLDWDATAEPYVDVVHVGADSERQRVAHALSGGAAQINVERLGPDGTFEVSLSNGVSARLVRIESTK